MFKLAHLSDIHLAPLQSPRLIELASKRLTGYINWRRNRAKQQNAGILTGLVNHLHSIVPDHTIITGDLVNLALPLELNNAARWLENLSDPHDLTLVCGNHDAYVQGALEEAIGLWQPYLLGDDLVPVTGYQSFPTLRIRDNIAIIGCNSALPTPPFRATGFFEKDQAARLTALLHEQKKLGHFRVVAIHHPPYAHATKRHKRLIGDARFRSVIEECGAELILHGHTHLDTINWLKGPDGRVPVVCVPAAGQAPGGTKPAARFNLFEISPNQSHWNIEMLQYGYADTPFVRSSTPGTDMPAPEVRLLNRFAFADG